jgi:hypothetical protein
MDCNGNEQIKKENRNKSNASWTFIFKYNESKWDSQCTFLLDVEASKKCIKEINMNIIHLMHLY